MEINTTESGSRVTRSLRKRLTSVDSDNSSRPGTPVASKLSLITEIAASPSRSTRLTRRNSISGAATPVKTPGKRATGSSAIITENADLSTPARRSTRRRSISVNENEEAHQLGIKITPFPALTEENISTEISCTTTKRITRSQSKSPQQQTTLDTKSPSDISSDFILRNESAKRRKPGPKCKTQKRDDADSASDVEICVVGKGINEIKSKSAAVTTIILTDDESNQTESTITNIKRVQEDENGTRGQSNFTGSVVIEEKSNSVESKSVGLIIKENEIGTIDKSTSLIETIKKKSNEDEGKKKNEDNTTPHRKFLSSAKLVIEKYNNDVIHLADDSQISIINIQSSDAGMNSEAQNDSQILNISEIKYTGPKLKVNEGIKAKEILKTSSEPMENIEDYVINSLPSYQQDIDKEHFNITSKPSSKKVDFVLSPHNVDIKNVYPKTPASIKTKINFLEVDSSHIEDSFEDSKSEQIEVLCQIDKTAEVKEKEVINTREKNLTQKTYDCIENLQIDQSSTPLNLETLANDERQANGSENTQTDKEKDEMKMKWINPSVKGTTIEGSKLDKVVMENVTEQRKSFIEIESENQYISERKKKSIVFTSDEDDEESNDQKPGNDEDEEFSLGEKEYIRKHDFHDDEAMEVDYYESGNSIDSEERKEMMENEIPVDGESIGSHTTDDENNECMEEEGIETDNSFVVSDNEEVECLESDDLNELEDKSEKDEGLQHNNEKKKIYKRLQLHSESSSADGDVQSRQPKPKTDEREITLKESNGDVVTNQLIHMSKESIYKNLEENSISSETEDKDKVVEVNQAETNSLCNIFNESSYKNLLDSSKLSDSALRLQCTTGSESEEDNTVVEKPNTSRKEILRNLSPTNRFNKSVRDLNIEVDTSSVEDIQSKSSNDSASDFVEENKIEKLEEDNVVKDDCKKELSVSEVATHSDDDKENERDVKLSTALSASFENSKKTGDNKGEKEWQRSFTIGVTVKGGHLDTTVTDIKAKDILEPISLSSSDVHDFTDSKNDDADFLENLRHMPLPLGNPLFRSRRQSLALPTNPNMEICSSNVKEINTKSKRMSLGILSNSDFKPSQSFIDSIELHKCDDHKDFVAKRKRLSKSFCGASDTLDNSVVDIDIQQLHKRTRIADENSIVDSHNDSSENINTTKLSTKISSTPHEKSSRVDPNNSIQLILNRCDDILEAANRARLEAKNNCKKSKVKLSKKQKNRFLVSADETKKDDVLRGISKEINRKDKIKTAVTQAIKTANKILNKKRFEGNKESKRLPSDVLEGIEKLRSTKMYNKKKIPNFQVKEHCYQTTATAIGNFVELPQSPVKRKKNVSYIQLPTGKISVEPVTPKKHSVQACNGTEFRESPVSPYATGFKVQEIPLIDKSTLAEVTIKGARKKRYYDETFKKNLLPKSQWTQSGTFLEEEIPTMRDQISCTDISHFRNVSKKAKKNSVELEHLNTANWNFKQKAMMRPDIKRSTNREALLLRQRRHAQSRY